MASLDLLILQKQEINKTGTSPHGISGFAVLQKQKISKTETSQHGICGVAILVDQHTDKNCLIQVQFYSFKDSTKENNLKAFSSVKSEIQQNTHRLLTVSRFLTQFFRKLEWPLLYTHCKVIWGNFGKTSGFAS